MFLNLQIQKPTGLTKFVKIINSIFEHQSSSI